MSKLIFIFSLVSLSSVVIAEEDNSKSDKEISVAAVASPVGVGAKLGGQLSNSNLSKKYREISTTEVNASLAAIPAKEGQTNFAGQAGVSYTTVQGLKTKVRPADQFFDSALVYSDGKNYFFGGSPVLFGYGVGGNSLDSWKLILTPKVIGTGSNAGGDVKAAGGAQVSGDVRLGEKSKAQGFILTAINQDGKAIVFGKVGVSYDLSKTVALTAGVNVSTGPRSDGKDVQDNEAAVVAVGGEAGLAIKL